MPDIELTTPARFWNLHTDELMEAAARDIYYNETQPFACHIVRMWGIGGVNDPVIQLHVYGQGSLLATPDKGTTLVHSNAGWEVLTDEQCVQRNVPLPPES